MRVIAAIVLFGFLTLTNGGAQDLPVIRFGSGPVDGTLPVIYAIQTGMFKRAGLDVQFVKLAGAAATAAALTGGSLEMGMGSTTAVVTAYAKGFPFTVFGSLANFDSEHHDAALVVAAKSSIHTPQDLAGQTMASTSLQDQFSITTFAWLAQHGVDWHTLKFVEVPPAATLAAMDSGRVVAAMLPEPYLSADLATGRVRHLGYTYEAFGPRWSEAVLFANVNWVNTHRDIVDRFLRVQNEATKYVGAHETELLPMLAEFGGLELSAIQKMGHSSRMTAIAPNDIQPVIDALAKYNVIPKTFNAQEMICACAIKR